MPQKRRSKRASEASASKSSRESSGWTIRVLDIAAGEIEALPRAAREHVLNFLFGRLRRLANPRRSGSPLLGDLAGFWRYRIDEYRIVCTIEDQKRLIRVVRVGHRYDVYGFEPGRG